VAGVGLVFVSHSERIAEGLVELARQMAPSVRLVAAGGTDDGGIGTSFDKVEAAVGEADAGAGVVVIGDLGSAIMTAETVVELLDPSAAAGVVVLDVPLVEGGVAAAVAAEGGADLAAVAAAARTAAGRGQDEATPAEAGKRPGGGAASSRAVLTDPEGLHARPAAELVKLAGRFESRVTVNGADARSLLAVLALGLRHGDAVTVEADGPDGPAAVEAVRELLGGGFG
jgi:phosphoenolpyruvate---glycerone phosphotransferase subunit DhaM